MIDKKTKKEPKEQEKQIALWESRWCDLCYRKKSRCAVRRYMFTKGKYIKVTPDQVICEKWAHRNQGREKSKTLK